MSQGGPVNTISASQTSAASAVSARQAQLVANLEDKEFRDLYAEEWIDTGLPFQIRTIREARGWTQQQLGERIGMTQTGVSRLESTSYGRFSVTTLKRLASAFDVALVVRFVPFSQLVLHVAELSPEDVRVPGFEHDEGLRSAARPIGSSQSPGASFRSQLIHRYASEYTAQVGRLQEVDRTLIRRQFIDSFATKCIERREGQTK